MKGAPKEDMPQSGKKGGAARERAPNWPTDPRVMELVVAKTVEIVKLPEVGGNPWQSRKLTETFRIVHEQLLASRDKVSLALPLALLDCSSRVGQKPVDLEFERGHLPVYGHCAPTLFAHTQV